jgi:hypothetical protein
MNYFDSSSIPEDERRQHAFQLTNAYREAIGLAWEKQPPTYEQVLDMIFSQNVEVYNSITSLLTAKNKSDEVKTFIELAEAQSTDEKKINPVDLIEEQLKIFKTAIESSKNKKYLLRKLSQLNKTKKYFEPRAPIENTVLRKDYGTNLRNNFISKPIYVGDNFQDFRVSENKILRVRLAHMEKLEGITGVDMVYEQFDLPREKVRFVSMQYKMWNTNILYFTKDAHVKKQLDKMEKHICNAHFCKGPQKRNNDFRFPFCSAFLRLTSHIQFADSGLISTGIHLPLCMVREIQKTDVKITKENSEETSLSHLIFEEAFHKNLVGSRWLSFDELENFYQKHGVNSEVDTIRLHCQEINYQSEEQEQHAKEDANDPF